MNIKGEQHTLNIIPGVTQPYPLEDKTEDSNDGKTII